MKPVRVTPTTDLLTLAEIKAHCRVDHSDDDAVLAALARAATERLDGHAGVLGRCLVTQVWRQDFPVWGDLRLWCPDVSAATVTYRDDSDASVTVDASQFEIIDDDVRSILRFKSGFNRPALSSQRSAPISVAMTAGFGAPAAVPAPLRLAALMLTQHAYENRGGDDVAEPAAVLKLITPYRVGGF